jgi:hypothetical protein
METFNNGVKDGGAKEAGSKVADNTPVAVSRVTILSGINSL